MPSHTRSISWSLVTRFIGSFDQCRQEVEGAAAERDRRAVDPQFALRQVYFAFA